MNMDNNVRKVYLVMMNGNLVVNCFDNKNAAEEYIKSEEFSDMFWIEEKPLFSSLEEQKERFQKLVKEFLEEVM